MGAFFMYKKEENLNMTKLLNTFEEKGFKNMKKFVLGEFHLLLYAKIIESKPQYYEHDDDKIFAVGTFIYKENDFETSLKELLNDCKNGTIKWNELLGHYTIIFYINNKITIMQDPTKVKHVFTTYGYSCFSSSLFAISDALDLCLTINKMAVYEKCLVGIIVSPDTIFKEIIQINKDVQNSINNENCGVSFIINTFYKDDIQYHRCGRRNSAAAQGRFLQQYLIKWKAAIKERVDLGLSGGYDSTLLLAATYPLYDKCLHIHTHSTAHIHDKEKNVALEMAKKKSLLCNIVRTTPYNQVTGNIVPQLLENLTFFDGRTSFDIGGLSPTYTSSYRMKATDNCMFTLTGVGGEVYRNIYSIVGKKINAEKFLNNIVFNPYFSKSVRDIKLQKEIIEYHVAKCERILGLKLQGNVDMLAVRRYYSEIIMPEGQGHVIDAYNTVSYCLAPYLDIQVIREAYKGMRYLGSHGEYEGSIIETLDKELAHCKSSYGYSFDHIPFQQRIKQVIRSRVSHVLWNKMSNFKNHGKSAEVKYLDSICEKCEIMEQAMDMLKKEFPQIHFSIMLRGSSMPANLSYLALSLFERRDMLN